MTDESAQAAGAPRPVDWQKVADARIHALEARLAAADGVLEQWAYVHYPFCNKGDVDLYERTAAHLASSAWIRRAGAETGAGFADGLNFEPCDASAMPAGAFEHTCGKRPARATGESYTVRRDGAHSFTLLRDGKTCAVINTVELALPDEIASALAGAARGGAK